MIIENLTIHDRTILLLKRDFPNSQTKGFRRAIQQLKWDWEDWDQEETRESKPTWKNFMEYGEAWKGGIIPDLWFIDEECMSVVCIEVEDTNRLNTSKLNQYVHLWWHLDNMYWEIHLLCADRWGNLTPVPITDFTAMGLVDISKHHLASLIEAERNAKRITFEMTKIYSIRNITERNESRSKWLKDNKGFGLRTNPRFSKEAFLKKRGLIT